MEKLKLIVAVADHGLGERMAAALADAGCCVCWHLAGRGTAKAAWLEFLGLTDTRKDVLLAPCAESRAPGALAAVSATLQGERHFAVTVSMSSIAGRDAYQMLHEGGQTHG